MRYFARLREIAGRDSEAIDPPSGATAADIYTVLEERYAALSGLRDFVRVALDRELVDWDTPVEDGSEIAFLPPVSGGAPTELEARADASGRLAITRDVVSASEVADLVRRPSAGAVVTFEGVVRNATDGHQVVRLEYDAYPEMALETLQQVASEIAGRWPDVAVAIHHRWGTLEIGAVAVAIAVASPHRAEAFDACRYGIDRLKEIVPIWKKEVGPDGAEWVGMGP